MSATWLHVSDFHFRAGDPYDRNVVLGALVRSVREQRDRHGRRPDLIFATGDVGFSGKTSEYESATAFFDALLEAAGLERRQLFVVPGNHEVDREQGIGLARTLGSAEEADAYFGPSIPKPHLTQKLGAFRDWYDRYFQGIRSLPTATTCGPVEVVDARGLRIAVVPLNSALFCQDDNDHNKLLVGRRCLTSALDELRRIEAHLKVALVHHPLEWLSDLERSSIRTAVHNAVDVVLRGHLHETDVESVVASSGGALHVAAGAAYQTRKWPNRALYSVFENGHLRVFPIRYEDTPTEIWTVDPSVFPREPQYEKGFAIPRSSEQAAAPDSVGQRPPVPDTASLFRSNIPSRGDLPFVGRDQLLKDIEAALGDPGVERVVVLHGPPGAGKSELARELARRRRDRYPGGTFLVRTGSGTELVDLAHIGASILGLQFPAGLSLQDQCERTLLSLGASPVLMIFDSALTCEAIQPWLPRAGMPCHVLVTTCSERLGDLWSSLAVPPLADEASLELVERVAGRELAASHGRALVALAGGLPVQLVPAARVMAYEVRRGRHERAGTSITQAAQDSFRLVYETLDHPVRLLLHAVAFLNCERIVRREVIHHLERACGWSEVEFDRHLDACLDFHLVEGTAELRMHQLLAAFLLAVEAEPDLQGKLEQVRGRQRDRFVEMAKGVAAEPANRELASSLLTYPLDTQAWERVGVGLSIEDGEGIGNALTEIGRFKQAQPWFERAISAKEQGDIHGRVDHESLGTTLHAVGHCLSSLGRFDDARPWYERAAAAQEQGDIQGRVDHESLGRSLDHVGYCLGSLGRFDDARPWHERAVAAKEHGDTHGRVDHESLGRSLHAVGYCLSGPGRFDDARPWFEGAVAAAEQGDIHGRVDHQSLATSLHEVGICLSGLGRFDDALPWFERAVAAAEQGDIHGRVDHRNLGASLHQVGICLSGLGRFDDALPWFERAVAAAEQGDIHGRVDHESLGRSLHGFGYCLSGLGRFDDARPWFERAVAAAEQGDIHGRVDHQSLATSLHEVGICLSGLGRFDDALPWFERAVAAAEQGDIHGRVDHESLGRSLHGFGYCLSGLGRFDDARPWYERSVAAKARGDIQGRVNHESLSSSLHQVGHCLSSLGRFDEARAWYERAVAKTEQGDIHGRVNHESLGTSLRAVARCLRETGGTADAQEWDDRASRLPS